MSHKDEILYLWYTFVQFYVNYSQYINQQRHW